MGIFPTWLLEQLILFRKLINDMAISIRPDVKPFFKLNSTEHEISTAHRKLNTEK